MNGRCFCGGIRFRLEPPTDFASHCHCESCRRSHAAPFVTWTSVPPDRFVLESGAELVREYRSSPQVAWEFCQRCGSSLFYKHLETPEKVYVAVAALDRLDRPVEGHASYEEHAPWLDLREEVPRYVGKTDERFRADPQV